ncbi:hypothetical protein F511_24181 [Dorcoceras hygrometricum]|uniref:Uncharacterized protein n=1 Tax=Dorcoceras hygrometricum TaxID=472368 RepID=A0A2Z7CKC8_9LAMI|nr:hypothetical protein F511_24181 [Dorcoceras hygrometricum]
MKVKAGQQNRFLRIVTIPIRALGKARDRYVRSMTDYVDKVNHSTSSKFVGVSGASGLPKSFSVNPARSYESEDFRELVRVASVRSLGTRVDLDVFMKQQTKTRAAGPAGSKARAGMPPRSSSVAMGRIDEDKACSSFGEETNVSEFKKELKNAPRSKSYVADEQTPPRRGARERRATGDWIMLLLGVCNHKSQVRGRRKCVRRSPSDT